MKLQNQYLTELFNLILEDFDSACLTLEDGQVLALKYENLADIGTLGVAAQTVQKYLNPQLGEAAILNDPYSGGTLLSSVTLVTPLCLDNGDLPKILLCARKGFRPLVSISAKLDEEGLRIPPTPIAQNYQVNSTILDAIAMHPMCPEGLKQRVVLMLETMWDRQKKFGHLNDVSNKNSGTKISKLVIKNYLNDSKKKMLKLISDLPNVETKTELNLDQGEVIKLALEISDEKISVNFRGTSPSQRVCLTDASTFGSCFGALLALLPRAVECNSGSFSTLEVSSPLGCLLNSKYPSPTYKGMTDGCALVAGAFVHAFRNIVKNCESGMSAVTSAKISLFFSDRQHFYDILPGGIGATTSSNGADALSYWLRNDLQPSIQEIEKRFPITINSTSIRKNSGGKGHFTGGNGLIREYQIHAPAKITWILEQTIERPSGFKGGQDGESAEVWITKPNSKAEKLYSEGSCELPKNTLITIHTAGGGGYGDRRNQAN